MNSSHDFTLIDLYSQRKTVNRYVANWSKVEILAWMCQYGFVTYKGNSVLEVFLFSPVCCSGLWAHFCFKEDIQHLRFREDGRLYIMVNEARYYDGPP
jgi:hypothetical protein